MFFMRLDPGDHFTKSRLAMNTLTRKISIPNNFTTVLPIHFKFDMMVRHHCGILMMYFTLTLTQGQRSNFKVKQKISANCVYIS